MASHAKLSLSNSGSTCATAWKTAVARPAGDSRTLDVKVSTNAVSGYINIIIIYNNFVVQFIEWKYILHFGGCIKTQYLSHVVTHVYSKIKHVNM